MKSTLNRLSIAFVALMTPWTASAADSAAACAEQTLGRFAGATLEYQVNWKGFSLESTRSLDKLDDGVWQASNNSSLLFMSIDEESRFKLQDASLYPQDYRYERKGLSKKNNLHLSFENAGKYQVYSPRGDDEIAYQGAIYDLLSHQMQIRIDLACKPPRDDYQYPVARRKGISDYNYRYVGEQSVETPAGSFEAVLLERGEEGDKMDRIWLAPELGYLIVRLIHQEDDDEPAELLLTRRPG
ncbi:DUF3108 domain-containing protein [Marinobacterium sp. YM272]|uniref:DUF3108 domain-containing protein n=1 Tax=Marinobacterium sp. YM272 TaxID=3421654 RepID=UPI003D7FDEC1